MIDKINGRTPEEIKHGLECQDCKSCCYDGHHFKDGESHCYESADDAVALINKLLEDKRQLENEQIAIFEDIRGICTLCAYAMPCYPFDCTGKDMGELCEKCPCSDCIKGSKWKYRGVKPNE